MSSLNRLTAAELSPLLRSRQLSPVELTRAVVDEIERLNPMLRAYITPLPERALAQAKLAEQLIMRGDSLGLLHGIPIGIKDNYSTKGIPTTGGAALFRSFVPDDNAVSVDRLLEAGAVMLGKLNMHELGGGLTNTNGHYGHVRNPWDLQRVAGGSSGGSGAAMTAGLAVLATGSDTFGSIRVPAALCGVYGLKPTYGLIDTGGIISLASSLDHAGPMARSAADLALMLRAMTGSDAHDESPQAMPEASSIARGLRIGVPDYFLMGLGPDVETCFRSALRTFESMGAELCECSLPELELSTYAIMVVLTSDAYAEYLELLRHFSPSFDQDVRILFQSGAAHPAEQYIVAQKARRVIAQAFKNTFAKVDVIAAPALPTTAPILQFDVTQLNIDAERRFIPFTAPAALAGTPCLSQPIGFSRDGLPIGMQLIGNHRTDFQLLAIGEAFAQAHGKEATARWGEQYHESSNYSTSPHAISMQG